MGHSVVWPQASNIFLFHYRLSVAVKHEMYYFLDQVYGTNNVSQIDTNKHNIGNLDTSQFVREAAHQIKDMIDR